MRQDAVDGIIRGLKAAGVSVVCYLPDSLFKELYPALDGGRIVAFDEEAILAEAREQVTAMKERNRGLFELVEEVGRAVI